MAMTPVRVAILRSLRFLACSGLSTAKTKALLPVARSSHTLARNALEDGAIRFTPHPSAKETVLVVGDGDLSYSASIATRTAESGGSLIASVLEKEHDHGELYRDSQRHRQAIASFESNQVLFETDATQLHKSFPPGCFDRIDFNFPHWRGKSNNKYNRLLLGGFLASAGQVLKADGEIQVALRNEQGGSRAQDLVAWRGSWKAAELAADAGLLLVRIDPFQPMYGLSSYRGRDRGFHVGEAPERYVFALPPHSIPVECALQLCYRHELRIVMDPACSGASTCSAETLLNDDIILELARRAAPEGVRVRLPAKAEITPRPGKNTALHPLLAFLLVYSGESIPLTRADADAIRSRLEETAVRELGFPLAKQGRQVSKPFPHSLLQQLLHKHS